MVIIRQKKDSKVDTRIAKITHPFDKIDGEFELFLQTSRKMTYDEALKYE